MDALVADLITAQSSLARDIEQLEAVQPEPISTAGKPVSQEEQRQIHDLEQEREQYHGVRPSSLSLSRSRPLVRRADTRTPAACRSTSSSS